MLLMIISLIVTLSYCNKNSDEALTPTNTIQKMNGVSFAAPNYPFDNSEFEPVVNVNANFICLMPFAFGQFDNTALSFDVNFQWWGEKTEGIIASAGYARENSLSILLKPHVWFWHGTFTGDFILHNEADWQEWEKNYTRYIVHFAHLADSLDIELYSIGVEFKKFVAERPDFWLQLIDTVRSIYDGNIIYSANWDNYKNVEFWDRLDYIGINAYFPLSEEKTPGPDTLFAGWTEHYETIRAFGDKVGKPVIFTEYGYKSIDFTASTPWDPEDGEVNLVAQQNAYDALFQKFWHADWFAGGFLWKWRADHKSAGGSGNKSYTPQNKPVEETIRYHYKKTNAN
jgi:hypothetical protein